MLLVKVTSTCDGDTGPSMLPVMPRGNLFRKPPDPSPHVLTASASYQFEAICNTTKFVTDGP